MDQNTKMAGRGIRRDPQTNFNHPLPTSSLRIIFQNVRGWDTNKLIHKQFFSKYNPDIIIINDTGIPQSETIKFYPYICYHINSEREHSGAPILVRNNIQHTRINPRKFPGDFKDISDKGKGKTSGLLRASVLSE